MNNHGYFKEHKRFNQETSKSKYSKEHKGFSQYRKSFRTKTSKYKCSEEHKSFNLELVNLIQNGIAVSYNLGRLYENNLGLIYDTLVSSHIDLNGDLAEDLLQVAFFAIYDSAIKYDKNKGMQYLNYLKLWLIHYFYQELIRMNYSFKITDKAYYSAKRLGKLSDFRAMDLSYLSYQEISDGIEDGSLFYTIHYEDIYSNVLSKEFWEIVKKDLTEMNYEIIQLRFQENLSYAKIAMRYGIGKERVRLRVLRSLNKLKMNQDIQIIAEDWYNIDVARSLREDSEEV